MEHGAVFLRDLTVVVGAAAVSGYLCHLARLPLVLGYLLAGALLSPHWLANGLITDIQRVVTLSELGLVFLIFSIGLQLGIDRVRRLGWTVAVGGWLSAIFMFNGGRFLGTLMGWSDTQSLFLAAVIMISSSAVISRLLDQYDMLHERHGQMALGVCVLEDITVVLVLTLLSSLGTGGSDGLIAQTFAKVGVFFVFAAIAMLLFVPQIIRRLSYRAPTELQNVFGSALLLGAAIVALNAGFSTVLGAFLMGCAMGSTPFRARVERVSEGLRDLFGAVFFVSTGMLVKIQHLPEVWHSAILLAVAAIVLRVSAVFAGLFLAGRDPQEALRVALCVTPLGEFSFVAARMGVDSGIMPQEFYPLAISMSIVTIVASPVLVGQSTRIATQSARVAPAWMKALARLYRGWRVALAGFVSRSLLWKLSRKRLIQVGVEMVFVSGALFFAAPVHQALTGWLEHFLRADWIEPALTGAMAIVLLVPVFAIWRNLEALSMIWAEALSRNLPAPEQARAVLLPVFRIASFVLLLFWAAALMPAVFGNRLVLVAVTFVAILVFMFVWRHMIRWHSHAEIALNEVLTLSGRTQRPAQEAFEFNASERWNLHVREFRVGDACLASGKMLSELPLRKKFNCSIVSIDRRGFVISNPPANTMLYPEDVVLMLGATADLDEAEAWLEQPAEVKPETGGLGEIQLEIVTVPAGSVAHQKTLGELHIFRTSGVQVVGIERHGNQIHNPGGDTTIYHGDQLLVLGRPDQKRALAEFLAAPRKGEENDS